MASEDLKEKLLQVGKKRQVTLPADFVDESIELFRAVRREDGTILLEPQVAVPAHQKYFWTERWQKGEKEASTDIAAGRTSEAMGSKKAIAHLRSKRKKK